MLGRVPWLRYEDLLPGEDYHDVGQNPQIGSSIGLPPPPQPERTLALSRVGMTQKMRFAVTGATQHTQLTRACITSYPVYA